LILGARGDCVNLAGSRCGSVWLTNVFVGSCAHRGTSCATIVLDVTKEPSLSSTDPVRSVVVIDPGPCAQEAEENMTGRPDDDSRMSGPYDQIAGLRVRDPLEAFDSSVEIVGVRVGIGESRSFVNRVHQVRTVMPGISAHFGIERGRDHCHPIVRSQRSISFPSTIPTRALPRSV